mmetsp:Transcript_20315/g.68726  ORF Transcript_20315/g.68726 Transcript_20315/m.68726 type:complete len:202 (+) Transcript_20315:431-1036(+)
MPPTSAEPPPPPLPMPPSPRAQSCSRSSYRVRLLSAPSPSSGGAAKTRTTASSTAPRGEDAAPPTSPASPTSTSWATAHVIASRRAGAILAAAGGGSMWTRLRLVRKSSPLPPAPSPAAVRWEMCHPPARSAGAHWPSQCRQASAGGRKDLRRTGSRPVGEQGCGEASAEEARETCDDDETDREPLPPGGGAPPPTGDAPL